MNHSPVAYRPDIDGLRAIAVASVVLYHVDHKLAPAGFFGVDIFFVISGYLIATILLKYLTNGRFSIIRFYERRARRIIPALVVAVVLTLVGAFWLLPFSETLGTFQGATATILFAANVYFWRTTNYFSVAAEERPLIHMWSLAVEEQFYLVFPILLFAIWRWRRSALLWIMLACAALSLLAAEFLWRIRPSANFYLPIGRGWELLAGCIAAVLMLEGRHQVTPRLTDLLSVVGLALVIIPIFIFDQTTPSPSVYGLMPVAGAGLIILFGASSTLISRVLGWKPLVGLGLISYSVYLYHQPLLAFTRVAASEEYQTTPILLVAGALSLPLGYLSWRYVESPFRHGYTRLTIFGLTGVSMLCLTLVGGIAYFAPAPIKDLFIASLDDEARENFSTIDASQVHAAPTSGPCKLITEYIDTKFEDAFLRCAKLHGPGIIVIGGSHAGDLFGALATASKNEFITASSLGLCRPHRRLFRPPPHKCHYEGILDFVERHSTDVRMVVYTQAYFTVLGSYRNTPNLDSFHPELISEVIDYLSALNEHVPVTTVGPKRTLASSPSRLDPRRDLATQLSEGYAPIIRVAEDLVDDTFKSQAAAAGIEYVSLMELLKTNMPGDAIIDGHLMFHDSDHWNARGETIFGRRIIDALSERGDFYLSRALTE